MFSIVTGRERERVSEERTRHFVEDVPLLVLRHGPGVTVAMGREVDPYRGLAAVVRLSSREIHNVHCHLMRSNMMVEDHLLWRGHEGRLNDVVIVVYPYVRTRKKMKFKLSHRLMNRIWGKGLSEGDDRLTRLIHVAA